MQQLGERDSSEIGKLLVLLGVFLFGCGCWMRVWIRGLTFPDPGTVPTGQVRLRGDNVVSFSNRPL